MNQAIDKREIEEVSNLVYNLIHADLSEMDYPPDEYDGEAAELIKWFRSLERTDGDLRAVAEKLRDIFSQNFEGDYSVEVFVPAQDGIKNILDKYEAIRNNLK